MFCDQTRLVLRAGNGGNGCVSFLREKYIAKGGPNGGNGGKGGDIYIKVNHALNTLTHLDTYKQFSADKGEHGKGSNRHGKHAEDLTLEVPQGTIVREVVRNKAGEITEKKDLADLSTKNKTLLVAKGGMGGKGNANFVSSVRQAPAFAELGEEGEEIEVELELKLVADIGIIGIPSAGKSTLISVVSNAKPKIADYPFTTLVPNLGVVKIEAKKTYVVADIPGLIEHAHEGKGLGIQFLKHVQRCRLLVHLIDPSQKDYLKNFHIINQELEKFSKDLAKKKQIVVINKADLLDEELEEMISKEFKKEIGRKKRFAFYPEVISAATTKGIKELKYFLYQELQNTAAAEEATPKESEANTHIIYKPHLDNPKYFAIDQEEDGVYRVIGQRIEQIANMTDMNNREAVNRIHDVLKKMGIQRELKKQGISDGDTLLIGKQELEFQSDV